MVHFHNTRLQPLVRYLLILSLVGLILFELTWAVAII